MDKRPTNNNVSAPPTSADDILDNIRRAQLKMPKAQTLCSTKYAPLDKFWHIEASNETFVIAHPSCWDRLRQLPELKNPMSNPLVSYAGYTVAELDTPKDRPVQCAEDEEWNRSLDLHRAMAAAIWRRIHHAIELASIPLPDWLKAAPKPAGGRNA
jgi:hypothetical protein